MIIDRWDPGIEIQSPPRLGIQGQQLKEGRDSICNRQGNLENRLLSELEEIVKGKEEDYGIIFEQSQNDSLGSGQSVLLKTEPISWEGMRDTICKSKIDFQIKEITMEGSLRSFGSFESMFF
ncbi:hypothetical protein HA466_0295300 [Hirschfeldia incana]|nr:hypothetical protein HA466_0295300 [Hirschfeldia incana]